MKLKQYLDEQCVTCVADSGGEIFRVPCAVDRLRRVLRNLEDYDSVGEGVEYVWLRAKPKKTARLIGDGSKEYIVIANKKNEKTRTCFPYSYNTLQQAEEFVQGLDVYWENVIILSL